MQPFSVSKVAMIVLMQRDLDAAVAFYHDLGLQLKFRMKNRWAEFDLNGVKIGLCPAPQDLPEQIRTGIVFEIGNLVDTYEKNKERFTFLTAPITASHGIMTSIQDPSGNIIDLYQPTPEKLKEVLHKVDGIDDCCKQEAAQEQCCKETKVNSCC